jgi:hypothetical protein
MAYLRSSVRERQLYTEPNAPSPNRSTSSYCRAKVPSEEDGEGNGEEVREEWDEALELEEVRRDKDGMSDVDAAKEDWEEEVITDFVRRKRPDEACFKFDISRTIGKHVVHGDYLNHPVLV